MAAIAFDESESRSILIVEDEGMVSCALAAALHIAGHRPLEACDLGGARDLLSARRPDLALIDYQLRRDTTELLLAQLKLLKVPTAVMTGYDAMLLPASYEGCPVLQKPFGMQRLLAVVSALG